MTSFQTYLIGFIILIIGLAGAAYLLGAPPVWIGIGVVVLIGIAVITASDRTPPGDRNPPRGPQPPTY